MRAGSHNSKSTTRSDKSALETGLKQRFLKSFDWLSCYQSSLEIFAKNGLKIEKVDLGLGERDPIQHRIQISYECPTAGQRIYGYGESSFEIIAYEKALAELLERESLFLSGAAYGITTTNGLGAHRFTILAKHAAKIELLERDAFLRHWLTRTPMTDITDQVNPCVERFREIIANHQYQLIIAETYLGYIKSTVAIIHDPRTGGFVLGSSASSCKKSRTRKAVSEAFLSLQSRDKDQVINWAKPDFDTHANYWYFQRKMPIWLTGTKKHSSIARTKPRFRFYILRTDPIPVVAAVSEDLIGLWTGPTPESVSERMKLQYQHDINNEPHPFP